jgi:hypothetical protein
MTNAELKKVNQALAGMFSSFPQSALADIEMQMRAYRQALNDANFEDIQNAIGRFVRGEVNTVKPQFVPSSAQLCIEVRAQRSMRELLLKPRRASVPKPVLPEGHFSATWELRSQTEVSQGSVNGSR